jgi:hypothetical protein
MGFEDSHRPQQASGHIGEVVLFRLGAIETTMRDLAVQVGKLVLIEERQTKTAEAQERAFSTLKEHDARLRKLELVQPITNRTNVWAERVVLVVVSAVGAVLLKLALTS